MELLQKILELLLEVTVFVESSPLLWKSLGYSFVENLVFTFAIYTMRLTIEVSLIRLLGYGISGFIEKVFQRLLPARYSARLSAIVHRPKPAWYSKLETFLRDLGYPGLIIAGFIPIPGVGVIGPAIYNLEQLHQRWYRFDNWFFACLLGGGLVKMAVCTGAFYHPAAARLWNLITQ